jgi:hypothetical protein
MPRLVKDGSLRVGGRTVQVSSVAKPFFPDAWSRRTASTTVSWPAARDTWAPRCTTSTPSQLLHSARRATVEMVTPKDCTDGQPS